MSNDLISRRKVLKLIDSIPLSGDIPTYQSCEEWMRRKIKSMAVEVCPTVDVVHIEEYEGLLRRFRHLLQSDFIRSFDEYDRRTGTYKRDISEADKIALVRHGWWIAEVSSLKGIYKCSECGAYVNMTSYALAMGRKDRYCAECGAKMDAEVEG